MSLFERLAQIKTQREGQPVTGMSVPLAKAASPPATESVCSSILPAAMLDGQEALAAGGSFCLRQRELKLSWPVSLPSTLIYTNLELIWGIGPVTAAQLKANGVRTIADLTSHRRFGPDARRVLDLIAGRQVTELSRRGATDAELMGLFSPEEAVFLDIETTGLWASQPLFLVGIMKRQGQDMVLEQLLARHYREERALLAYLAQVLKRVRVMVTFNGKRFDWPYIKERFIYYHLPLPKEMLQVDLYFHAKRLPHNLPNCKLVTLEENLLGHEREGDVPGYLVPTIYHRFVQTQDPCLLAPVLEHNVQDVITLAQLLPLVMLAQEGTTYAGAGG